VTAWVKPIAVTRGGEASPPRHAREDSGCQDLLEQVLVRENLQAALQRVKRNKGSAGVDGMTVAELPAFLRTHWPRLRRELLDGTYRPQPVRRHAIPKPGGGERELGIPTVLDRFIQQALLQVLQPLIDPSFSDASYGFRPGRRAHDAIRRAQRYVEDGYRIVVDVDLEKFFDRVNHDILMDRLSRRIADPRILWLIRRYLDAGVMLNGVRCDRQDGTPQGGPLSPLLANVLLDEVDRALERHGHRFVRYADDCNVYVRSQRAGERVLRWLRRCYARLKLTINDAKSAVGSVSGRAFLGYTFWLARDGASRRTLAAKAVTRFKERIRELTGRSRGRSMAQVVAELRAYVPGWKAYFQLVQTPRVFVDLDGWLRRRLRTLHLAQWRHGRRIFRELRVRGAPVAVAQCVAFHARRWWRNGGSQAINSVLTIAYFDALGVPRLSTSTS
jgi:RNA-directed DNA polymerase